MLEVIQNFAAELGAYGAKNFHISLHTPEYNRLEMEIKESISLASVDWHSSIIDKMTNSFDINITGVIVHVSEIRTVGEMPWMSLEEYNKKAGL